MLLPHTPAGALSAEDARALGEAGAEEVERHLAPCPAYAPTPLVSLPALAAELGVASLHLKDEGARLGLGSFKALGGAWAVIRLVLEEAERRLGRPLPPEALRAPEVRAVAAGITFGCATDGNHGRSVAAGARLAGARAVVWVHGGVSEGRVAAIAAYGAEVVRVPGSYDDSVAEAARRCEAEGWRVVSDTSWPGYDDIPRLVMQGYTVSAREALRALGEPPTHLLLQAGVGGFAAAVAAHLRLALGERAPRVAVVEPARAACVLESARAGRPRRIPHGEPTVMAMLECYEPSHLALRILLTTADLFLTVEEEDAVAAMRRLARPLPGDPAVVAGESGGAGVAALLRAARDPAARAALRLEPSSRVLAWVTEGATDPARYRELVGEE